VHHHCLPTSLVVQWLHENCNSAEVISMVTMWIAHFMVKVYPIRSVDGVLISLTWARRWINHSSLWRMASVTPDLSLPSQLQEIAAPRLAPNYTAWWQRHMCVNNLPKVITWQQNGWESNSRPLESQANVITITPPGQIFYACKVNTKYPVISH